MIYLFQELDLISNELLHQMIFSLPVARREYVQHFKIAGKTRSDLPWPGCFCVMDLNRNMDFGKFLISSGLLPGNQFFPRGKI